MLSDKTNTNYVLRYANTAQHCAYTDKRTNKPKTNSSLRQRRDKTEQDKTSRNKTRTSGKTVMRIDNPKASSRGRQRQVKTFNVLLEKGDIDGEVSARELGVGVGSSIVGSWSGVRWETHMRSQRLCHFNDEINLFFRGSCFLNVLR